MKGFARAETRFSLCGLNCALCSMQLGGYCPGCGGGAGNQSCAYIEQHLREELTIQDIAQRAALSPFYFQKGFAMLCGMTVGDYIRQRRLSAAGLEASRRTGRSSILHWNSATIRRTALPRPLPASMASRPPHCEKAEARFAPLLRFGSK